MLRLLDRVTGRVTMYRLVLIVLLAIAVEALLVSLTGQLDPYEPVGILVTGAVAVVVSYLSNRLFAFAFRVAPHSESSLITGVILLFLFRPILDGADLLAVALAALVASASKYLLAIRRRHIFNPAAIGGLVVGLILPLNAPGWWVATPWLLPLVAVGAFVVLYRTRHLALGGLFVVVSVVLVVVFGVLGSSATLGDALQTALLSYPIIFLAGFMLSEPLTLPPRRWQQLTEATIVGVIFGVQSIGFHLGPLYASPQLALLVGNLLAFLVGQRRGIRLRFIGREQLTPTSWELSFAPLRPLRFAAGQFMELTLPHAGADLRGLRRTFSIASSPTSPDIVRFGIRVYDRSSSFKTALLALKPGDTVTATAIGGDFTLPRDVSHPLLLIAGGIGITPFMSQLSELEASSDSRDVVLVYSASSPEEVAYAERLDAGGHRVLLVAPTAPGSLPSSWTYLGDGPLTAELLLSAVPDARERRSYVSGAPALVRDVTTTLRRAGVRRVKRDYFSGY